MGWIQGVYVPCLLNIWGVMLFLRLTWVVGQTGLIEGLALITTANCVTIITALSMSAISTNGQIKAGGIYYMISRSLGPEFGGAVGLMFTTANSIAVSMYIIGFCESFLDMLEQYVPGYVGIVSGGDGSRINDVRLIGSLTLALLLGIAIIGMGWVSRIQIGLLGLLLLSQVDFLIGSGIPPSVDQRAKGFIGYNLTLLSENLWSDYREENGKNMDFFSVFAVFFPAVTGIVAGANLSGDLKDPGKAIPKGTLLAIFSTYISYVIYTFVVAATSLREASGILDPSGNNTVPCESEDCPFGTLVSQQMMQIMSLWGPLIYAGCFAATLSSAIASLVGAPRVFQAVAKDKLFPGIAPFAKGWGANNDPIRGYILVFIISLVCIIIGDLNQVSSLLSNFFVATYAVINYAVFHASINNSPGWRPSFKYFNKWISLLGTALCISVMVLMDYITALVTLICIILLYVFVATKSPDVNWGSSSQSQTFISALKAVQTLAKVEDHVKNYRPKLIVLSGCPADRPLLVDFAYLITKRISLLQLIHIVSEDLDLKTMNLMKVKATEWLQENQVKAFYSLARSKCFTGGVQAAIELSGLGKLSPNMVLMGFQESWWMYPHLACEYHQSLQTALDMHMAVGVLRVKGGLDVSDFSGAYEKIMETSRQVSDISDNSLESSRNNSIKSVGSSHKRSNSIGDFRRFDLLLKRDRCGSDWSIKDGNPIDERLIRKMTQFRDKSNKEGFIDVYWLYDDGGLTLLIPHILSTRAKFAKCNLRIFILAGKKDDIKEETESMAALLEKFRIKFQDVIVVSDATKKPTKQTKDEFERLIRCPPSFRRPKQPRNPSVSSLESLASMNRRDSEQQSCLTEEELKKHSDLTHFHLRIAEIAKENSSQAALVVMTLPLPKKEVPFTLYMSWLEIISKNLSPFLFVRGNQESVLTFYS